MLSDLVHENEPDESLPHFLENLVSPTCPVPGVRFYALTEEWNTSWRGADQEYTLFLAIELPDSFTTKDVLEAETALTEKVIADYLSAFGISEEEIETGPAFFTRVLFS